MQFEVRHYTSNFVQIGPTLVKCFVPMTPGKNLVAEADRLQKPVNFGVNRPDTLGPALVKFGGNHEVPMANIEIIPFEVEDHFPADRRGGNKGDQGFPPERPEESVVETPGILVTGITPIDGGVEGIGVRVRNFPGQSLVRLGRSNPGSFLDPAEGVAIPGTGGTGFGPNGVEVPAVFADGFGSEAFGLKTLKEAGVLGGIDLGEQGIADEFDVVFDGGDILGDGAKRA
jgi:hypothetical protein